MKKLAAYLLFLGLITVTSCQDNDRTDDPQDWTIPSDEIFDGGPGKDGIPSIDQPMYTPGTVVDYLEDDDLIVGVINNGIPKAYPHFILDWHEIVNDRVGDVRLAVTYCPLTGTAIGWNRIIDGEETQFGVSGKLYNTNLIPYDRMTDSYWSQIGLECVNGDLLSRQVETYPVIETSWKTWNEAYPNSFVLNTETGFDRSYGVYPYGDYITNDDKLFFPVEPFDERLPAKERVLGVIDGGVQIAYSIELFANDRLIQDGDRLVFGSKESNFIVAYNNSLGLQDIEMLNGELPHIAKDADGNMIGLDGRIMEGPMAGSALEAINSFIGYWFSFGAFYPGIEIYSL